MDPVTLLLLIGGGLLVVAKVQKPPGANGASIGTFKGNGLPQTSSFKPGSKGVSVSLNMAAVERAALIKNHQPKVGAWIPAEDVPKPGPKPGAKEAPEDKARRLAKEAAKYGLQLGKLAGLGRQASFDACTKLKGDAKTCNEVADFVGKYGQKVADWAGDAVDDGVDWAVDTAEDAKDEVAGWFGL